MNEARKEEAKAEEIGMPTKDGAHYREKRWELESPQVQRLGKGRNKLKKEWYLKCVPI